MALTIQVIPGYIAEVGKPITVADLNKGFLPTINLTGAVGSNDLQDGSIHIRHLYSEFLKEAQASSAAASTDLLLLGTSAGTANRSVTVTALLSGMWSSPVLYQEFNDWDADRVLWQTEAGEVRAIAPNGLASSLLKQAPLASVLGDYAANLVGVNQSSGATAMKIADLAKALITQAPSFVSPEALATSDEVLVNDVSTGKVSKTTISTIAALQGQQNTIQARNVVLPTAYNTKAGETPHAFGATPSLVGASFECTDAAGDAGYSQGDVIPSSMVHSSVGGADQAAYAPIGTASTIYLLFVVEPTSAPIVPHKTTGAYQTPLDPAKWRAHLYAAK